MTDALYLVADRSVRAHKNKPGQYLQLQLQDRTGTIKAMYWDVPTKVANSVKAGDVYLVSGNAMERQFHTFYTRFKRNHAELDGTLSVRHCPGRARQV